MAYLGHVGDLHVSIYDLCSQLSTRVSVRSFLDLGSRHGECLDHLDFGPGAIYTLVEPSPRCLPHIMSTMECHSERDIRLLEGVLGPSAGHVDLHVFEGDSDQSANIFSDRGGRYGRTTLISVPILPYVSMDGHYDMAKVNIEGAEYALMEDGFFDRLGSFVMEAHNVHVPGKKYTDLLDGLCGDFDITSHGDLSYKYCFLVGIRA